MGTHGTLPPSGAEFKMIDVGTKPVTRRRAVAQGRIRMSGEAIRRILAKDMPKGDVLTMAEVAGIMAAKRTAESLPLCHPLPLDRVTVSCQPQETPTGGEVVVSCEAIAHAQTGVEMEALCGVTTALLAIYDLTKVIDAALEIDQVYLQVKEGGKSGTWVHPIRGYNREPIYDAVGKSIGSLDGIGFSVLTVSDRCFRNECEDQSGQVIQNFVRERGGWVESQSILPDDVTRIGETVRKLSFEGKAQVAILTGGTGPSVRDVTPEALAPFWTKRLTGIGEYLRHQGSLSTPMSWLSRSEAGFVGEMLVILLPGNPRAVSEGLVALEKLIPHTLAMYRGGKH